MVAVEELDSKNKELDTGVDEGGGEHDVGDVGVVVVDDEGVAHGDSWEESRWKREKDSEIPSWFVPVTSTLVLENVLFFVS